MTDITASIVATMRHPVLVLDADLRVALLNPAFETLFAVSGADQAGRPLSDLGDGQWNMPELLDRLAEVRDRRRELTDFRIDKDFEGIGRRKMLLNARYLQEEPGPGRILVAIEDVTERERILLELEGQQEFVEKIVDASRASILILDWDLRVRVANRTFYETFQVDPAETEGRLVHELGEGDWDIPRLRELLEEVLPEDHAFDDFEVEHEFPQIGNRRMLLNARRLDHLQLILLAIEDVTERERSLQALQASQQRLRKVLETDAIGVIFFDHSGTVVDANEIFLGMTGYSGDDVRSGRLHWRDLTPPEWVADSETQMEKLAETGRIGPYEKEFLLKGGGRSWMMFVGRDLGDGTVVEFCIDISERKQAEHERELLTRELSHRVKNTLAVVQSLARMTNGRFRSVEAYRETFLGRLQALSRAHSLLLDEHWQGTDLRQLVQLTIQAFEVDSPDTTMIEGDSVALSAQQAMGLSLVLHELGTNAVKYGSLSQHGGKLRIAWATEETGEGDRVRLTWKERGGPPVSPPEEHGFGTEMIRETCSYELDGEARLDFAPEGLTCEIVFPME